MTGSGLDSQLFVRRGRGYNGQPGQPLRSEP